MAKVIIEIEDMPEGTDIKFKGDLPAADAKDKTGAQQTAVLISKMIQAAQMMTPPIRRH
uniref:Uncharacterized protein n=1 Tax=Myoviridae sp. ctGkq5 TaxID=2825074 RepID=A0A8S5QI21_9CAUD|nr:MAG TPA: hypothetical protein [Myoviridae sp. ctGkq5]